MPQLQATDLMCGNAIGPTGHKHMITFDFKTFSATQIQIQTGNSILRCHTSYANIHTYIHFQVLPRGAFQQPVYNKCKARRLRVSARPL